MRNQFLPGAWYVDATPDGRYVAINDRDALIESHLGTLAPPDRLLYPRITTVGGFQIAGVAHTSDRVLLYRDGVWFDTGQIAHGTSPVIFDRNGSLLVATPAHGSQGFRYVREDGAVVTGDASYAPSEGVDLFEWTRFDNGWWFGQGPGDGALAGGWAYKDGQYYKLVEGAVRFMRVARDGDRFSLACWVERAPSAIVWGTFDEIPLYHTAVGSPRPPVVYAPVVEIGRPLWFGFYEFGAAGDVPSNCRIPVVQGAPWLDVVGPGWRYVAGNPDGDVSAIADAIYTADADFLPDILAYVPRHAQYAIPSLKADIIGIECYLGADETDADFLKRIAISIRLSRRAVLIAQCYTSNTNHTQDLRRIPGLISALARDHANVEGIVVFSAGSRATGWNDHPEVHDAWHQVFRGIMGAPEVSRPEPEPEPLPEPEPPVVVPPVLPEPEPLPEVGNTPEPEPSVPLPAPEVKPVTKKKINGVKIVKDLFRALAKWDVAKLLGLKKKRQAPGPHLPPAPEPEPEPPVVDAPPELVVFPTRAQVLTYRGHLCNLKDSAGRVIWTPSLAGAPPEIRKEWLETIAAHGGTHVPIGPFEGGPSYPGVHWGNPDWTNDPFAIRSLVFDVLNTKTLAGHGMVPVLFLDGGGYDPKPRIQEFYEVAHEALEGLYEHVLCVPCGWEPVVGSWTSAEVSYALKLWHAIAPGSIIAYHGSPGRLVGSSNPVEADDPWQGGESEFYKTHGGEHIDVALYQTPHGRELYEDCDPNSEGCWLDRWRDYVTRIGGGLNGWRQMPIVLFESVAYEYFRNQKTDDDARTIASRAKKICDDAGVPFHWGNGAPWESN